MEGLELHQPCSFSQWMRSLCIQDPSGVPAQTPPPAHPLRLGSTLCVSPCWHLPCDIGSIKSCLLLSLPQVSELLKGGGLVIFISDSSVPGTAPGMSLDKDVLWTELNSQNVSSDSGDFTYVYTHNLVLSEPRPFQPPSSGPPPTGSLCT